jgi:hypothetical protein
MLGNDQAIAFEALGAAFTAEDQQQAQVRRFRGVLIGTFACLLAVVAVLWVLGAAHPSLIPLCLQGNGAGICPA